MTPKHIAQNFLTELFLSFSVDDGAIMDVQFTNFYHRTSGFDEIMIEKSLL